MGEKFTANPVTGTGSLSVPIATSPGRAGFGPQLSLSYDSGAGNGPFGLGWNLASPSITRKTDKGLPQYTDAEESDVFIFSGAEDLVPVGSAFDDASNLYRVQRYQPRIEGAFSRIERFTRKGDPTDVSWRSISRDNITTWYGTSPGSRIADPADASRIFTWLVCESYDDKGNLTEYEHVAEDDTHVDRSQAHERNRSRTANRYPKKIKYGNTPSRLDPDFANGVTWHLEVHFDYGDEGYREDAPDSAADVYAHVKKQPPATRAWPVRLDPQSNYRAGFEVRTYRLCRRVLMFHRFDELLGDELQLVRSTDIGYDEDPIVSRVVSVTHCSYVPAPRTTDPPNEHRYLKKTLPPLAFEYTRPDIDGTIRDVDADSLENLPDGFDGANYQWIDLDGEGLPGVLSEQADGWFYKRNLAPVNLEQQDGRQRARAKFAPVELVAAKPSASIAAGAAQLMDLAGDGQLDLVMLDGPTPGFFEHDGDVGWESFRAFIARLNRSIRDPNLRFVDLDGDGRADVLVTEDEALTWHASLGEDGFGPARRVFKPRDEEGGPALIFADGTQSIYLADMSGDGLTDLVRIRNAEVCYWPNLGYGLFGAKVTMDNAPRFDAPDQFDQRRVHLADIDGSGLTDIVYLHGNGVRLYFNRSGNSWSAAREVPGFPRIDTSSSVTVLDFLGNGTACLVWTSTLPGNVRRPMKYVDLMGGQKPHLLVRVQNNLGATTTIEYTPSTRFYLQDKLAGQPWITRLPFPVHCVSTVTLFDKWRNATFSSTYSYHHGYFDGVEREFRGFGRVEQVDTESFDKFTAGNRASPYITDDLTLHQPPIKTVTWFHTGAFLDGKRIVSQFSGEYFSSTLREKRLPELDLETQRLSADEWREALRACKGRLLRQEIYELDIDVLHTRGEHVPVKLFTTASHNYSVRRLKAKGDRAHAVFLVTENEAITYNYELGLLKTPLDPDPRIAHALTLDTDEFGNVRQSVAVVYPRRGRHADNTLPAGAEDLIAAVQKKSHLVYTETRYTDDPAFLTDPDNHRLPVPCDVRTYELSGIQSSSTDGYFTLVEMRGYKLSDFYRPTGTQVDDISYHSLADTSVPPKREKRLVEHLRTLFFTDDLQGFLTLGKQGTRSLVYESYKLALTEELLNAVFGAKLTDPIDGTTARAKLDAATVSGYLHGQALDARFSPTVPTAELAGQYWIRSGTADFASDAARHFYLPERYIDPFEKITTLKFDRYDLFIERSSDHYANTVSIERYDFRVLAPCRMKDINDNFSEVVFDVLGSPAAMALEGKGTEGDNLGNFNEALINPGRDEHIQFFTAAYSKSEATRLLGNATVRYLYYFGEQRTATGLSYLNHPPGAAAIVRETHVAAGGQSLVQSALEYSDGSGNVLVKKVQAEPDPLDARTPPPLRWIANGKTVLNNKGKPVKQYEPYFSTTEHCFNAAEAQQEVGVTPIMYYDAAGRLVRTELPDGSFSRVEFSPWHLLTYDANDTAYDADATKRSDWYNRRTEAAHPRFADFDNPEDRRAATLVEMHANTPAATFLDSLSRNVVSVAHNTFRDTAGALRNEKYLTFTKLDAEGKPLWIRDARGNLLMQYITPPVPNNQAADPSTGFVPGYDLAGNLLFQHSMDAGARWMLTDAAGKPMLAWEFNKHQDANGVDQDVEDRLHFTAYDALHRPTHQWLAVNRQPEKLVAYTEYGEALADAKQRNLRGQAHLHYDPSGLNQVERLDFKGKPLEVKRTLTNHYDIPVLDWNVNNRAALLEADTFSQVTEYDALGRVTLLYNWHRAAPNNLVSVYVPTYNERGLLRRETLDVGARKIANGHTASGNPLTIAIEDIRYDVKGRKEFLKLGNETVTRYTYDRETFRLRRLYTRRDASFTEDCGGEPPPPRTAAPDTDSPPRSCGVQNLLYTYDPVGNITHIQDDAQDTIWFANRQVDPSSDYTYDALYRLITATGRENSAAPVPPPHAEGNWPSSAMPSSNSVNRYTQRYEYDGVGNFLRMEHKAFRGPGQGNGDWTLQYQPAVDSNRLARTWYGTADWDHTAVSQRTEYRHDAHGSMLNLANTAPGLDVRWDWRDMIGTLDLQGGGDAFYNYDADKRRTRKRIVRNGNIIEDRLYLGGYELYRRYNGTSSTVPVEEIESHHVFEGDQRLLLIDDVVKTDRTHADLTPYKTGPIFRYHYSNHLGSACLELDEHAQIISYEEYHPYGTSAYRVMKSGIEAPPQRYRFTGMERDDESGLNYHAARYYVPGTGRWLSADPAGEKEGTNLYAYVKGNPCGSRDRGGMKDEKVTEDAAYFAKMASWFFSQGYVQEGKEYQEKARSAAFAEAMAEKKRVTEEGEKVAGATWIAMGVTIGAGVTAGFLLTELASVEISATVMSFLKPRVLALAIRLGTSQALAPGGYVMSSTAGVTGFASVGTTGTALVSTGVVASGTTTAAVALPVVVKGASVATVVGVGALSVAVAVNPDPLGLNQHPSSQQQVQEPVLENDRTRASRGYTQNDLKALVQQFLAQLPADERERIARYETVAIALVQEDGYQHIWYAVAGNRTSATIRAAAEQLGFERVTATPRAEGRGDVGAPADAEQLLLEAADANDVELLGKPEATRPYCADCACAVCQ